MVALGRYTDTKRPMLLYVAVVLVLCAAYTKISGAFLFLPLAFTIWAAQGHGAWRDKHVRRAALLATAALLPLVFLTIEFGAANLRSVVDAGNLEAQRTTIEGWFFYARQVPALLGWPLLLLAAAAPILIAHRRLVSLARGDIVLLASWFIVGYIIFSLIDLKGARHALFFLPPMLIASGLAASMLLPRRVADACLVAVVAALGVYTLVEAPVPAVAGYRTAAEWIAAHADKNAIIAFSGERDGSFLFNLRAIESRRDITTLRSDKLLLSVAVSRQFGVGQKSYSEAEIHKMLDEDGVSFVVAQDDFWTDLAPMARLNTILHSPHFTEVFSVPVAANVPTRDKMLRIYRNVGDINRHPGPINLDLPTIGRSISGKL